jgi:hypothetical protein
MGIYLVSLHKNNSSNGTGREGAEPSAGEGNDEMIYHSSNKIHFENIFIKILKQKRVTLNIH